MKSPGYAEESPPGMRSPEGFVRVAGGFHPPAGFRG
jgi:hypothetical protein